MLQEIMSSSSKACDLFLKIYPMWKCVVLDACGQYGGILVAWNPTIFDFNPFSTIVGLVIEGKFCGLDKTIKILNFYGLYLHRKVIWDNLVQY